MDEKRQMSDTIRLGIVLALAGGFMDAYSYILRDGVFANAQTGNMLLFGVYLSERNFQMAIRYIFPVASFTIGIVCADVIRFWTEKEHNEKSLLHWRQIAVLLEILVLCGVSFMPQSINLLANCLTSLACGIQVESFRKIRGNAIATTMCIGNLRSATQNYCTFFLKKNRQALRKGCLYIVIIVSFVIGAVIGNICVGHLSEKSILINAIILMIAFIMMFIEEIESESLRIHAERK